MHFEGLADFNGSGLVSRRDASLTNEVKSFNFLLGRRMPGSAEGSVPAPVGMGARLVIARRLR